MVGKSVSIKYNQDDVFVCMPVKVGVVFISIPTKSHFVTACCFTCHSQILL